ncbi:MAG: signal recognition particle-docking protein FtsY [Desulfohalobiaceae bacterium]
MGFFSRISKLWKKTTTDESLEQEVPAGAESPGEPGAALGEDWQNELLQSLQQAEPRLSVWLDLVLQEVDRADEQLWNRLFFLLDSLQVPREEAEEFVESFRGWLRDMEYERVEEFRSELQYRLALALDLEDEEDERSRLFEKLSHGLTKTRQQLSRSIDQLLSRSDEFGDQFWEELEEILITADVGFQTTTTLVDTLKQRVRDNEITTSEAFKELFQEELARMFPAPPKRIKPIPPEIVLMLGVNGVGKTTTIAKLAHRARMQGYSPLIAAGDTFRAAAIEQLEIWAQRVGAGFSTKESGADPAAVAYEALDRARSQGYDLLFIDTAGRLHTKTNLMEELKKIKRVLSKHHSGSPHRSILVVDATTGQNAVSQTKLFQESIGVDEIVLTKLDGTAKGGVVLGISLEQGVPITYIGLGEKMEDLRPFDGESFARALLE